MNLARRLFGEFCTRTPRAAFALAMLWNSAAYAQSAPTVAPTQPPAAPSTSAQITPASQASQLGNQDTVPRRCDGFLPPGVTYTPGWVHSTLISYRLTATGDIRDVALYRSSGNNDLDKAALACIGNRHTEPVMVAGTPADISWIGGVSWASRWHQFVPTDLDGEPNLCDFSKWSLREVRPPRSRRHEGLVPHYNRWISKGCRRYSISG